MPTSVVVLANMCYHGFMDPLHATRHSPPQILISGRHTLPIARDKYDRPHAVLINRYPIQICLPPHVNSSAFEARSSKRVATYSPVASCSGVCALVISPAVGGGRLTPDSACCTSTCSNKAVAIQRAPFTDAPDAPARYRPGGPWAAIRVKFKTRQGCRFCLLCNSLSI